MGDPTVTTATQTKIVRGDSVLIKPEHLTGAKNARWIGVVFEVIETKIVNLTLRSPEGTRMTCRREYLAKVDPRNPPPAALLSPPHAETIPFQAPLDPGALVTVSSPRWKEPEGVYVVLRSDFERNTSSLAPLGGGGGRYWNRVPRTWLTEVEVVVTVVGPKKGLGGPR